MQAAEEAGGDRRQMEHLFGMLRTALLGVEISSPEVIGVISSGYLSAFADAGPEWDRHIKRAKMSLRAIGSRIGELGDTLETVMENFNSMRRNNPAAARIFGFGLVRLHPETAFLAEATA